MVGSRDFFDDSIDGQVNVATSPRQPGSSMKPIVYATLFGKGYTPNTILYDVSTNFSTDPANPYTPQDYDGKERGPVTIRQALAGSLNIPAVKAIYLAGVNNVLDLADNLGYTTLADRSRFGLALVLGGAEVKLLEHVNAYSAFARDGQISPIVSILKVEDKNGNIIEQYQPSDKQVLDSQIVREVNSILTDNNARAYIFGEKNSLTLGDRPVAAKTGTTNDYRDAWTIGYTPSLVTGVWVGNSDNKAMTGKADGSVVAAPIWHDFMAKVLGNTPVETFQAPADYTTGKPILDGQIPTENVRIEKSSGLIAASSTPEDLVEEKTIPSYHDILYYVNKDNPLGPAPTDPSQDPQFASWESSVQKWVNDNIASSTATINYSAANLPENKPTLKIDSPSANQVATSSDLTVQIEATALRGISQTDYYLNNNLWETKWGAPGIFTKSLAFLNNGYQALKVKTCDDAANCTEGSVNFNLMIKNNPISTGKNTIKIAAPATGLSLNSNSFPLTLNLQVSQPLRIAQINLIVRASDGTIKTVKTLTSLNGKDIIASWDSYPAPGEYSLYAELRDWNGDVINSNEIKISVN